MDEAGQFLRENKRGVAQSLHSKTSSGPSRDRGTDVIEHNSRTIVRSSHPARGDGESVTLSNSCANSGTLPPQVHLDNNCSSVKRTKLELEHKEIKSHKAQRYTILFETYPLWLFSIARHITETVYIPDVSSLGELRQRLSEQSASIGRLDLYDALVNDLGRRLFVFQQPPEGFEGLFLVSGSVGFINQHLISHRGIGIVDTMWRGRKLPPSQLKLLQLRHVRCGGATNFCTLWTYNKLTRFDVAGTSLRRSLGDFLDYGVAVRAATSEVPPDALIPSSVFPVGRLHDFVYYRSGFCRNNWCKRRLTGAELANMWGLPLRLASLVRSATDLPPVPLTIGDQIIQGFLATHVSTPVVRDDSNKLDVPRIVNETGGVWLHSLGQVLPNTWRDKGIANLQSAKNDDAKVERDMWDYRILPLFPHLSTRFLDTFRCLVLRQRQRRIYVEFVRWLWQTHPLSYPAWLRSRGALAVGVTCLSPRRGGKGQCSTCLWRQKGNKSDLDRISQLLRKAPPLSTDTARLLHDVDMGIKALSHVLNSNFWEWSQGSALLFWRWPAEWVDEARDGFRIALTDVPPSNKSKPRKCPSHLHQKIWSKLRKFLHRGYLKLTSLATLKNLTDFFAVPKGTDDIRMVFNGTKSGLTAVTWAPSYWLPNAPSMLRTMSFGHRAVDIDLGEYYVNLPLHKDLQALSGIDLSQFKREILKEFPELMRGLEKEERLVAEWLRIWMGLRSSPEWAARFYYIAEEFVRGNERDIDNPLYWDKIVINAIGNDDFNPSLPWVYKYDSVRKLIAGDIRAYVDDLRTVGWSLEHAWKIARAVASRLQYLGIQDAPRKRRIDEGPWAGTVFTATEEEVSTTVTSVKWLKGRSYVLDLIKLIGKDPKDYNYSLDQKFPTVWADYKTLERMRGYFCHLAMTFPILFPYLKGFHLTLSSHLRNRDEEGWKISDLEMIGHVELLKEKGLVTEDIGNEYLREVGGKQDAPPKKIKLVPRFFLCLKALSVFFSSESPPVWSHRKRRVLLLLYGFHDASKGGLGTTKDWGDKLTITVGTWGADSEEETSNWREFTTLVQDMEHEEREGKLNNAWVVMATDSSTVEGCLYKGNSSSEKLFDLIVRLRAVEMRTGATILITHVSGRRMIAQGTDGVSRGSLREGVCVGETMRSFCPWGKSAIEQSPKLLDWLKDWLGHATELLTPEGWFGRGHDHKLGDTDEAGFWRVRTESGTFVWDLPPVAADAAIEELRKARTKRRASTHVVVVHRVFTTLWLKQLIKCCDVIVYIPPKFDFWGELMFEPLCIGFALPHIHCRPWQLRRTPKLLAYARQVHNMCETPHMDPRAVLRKLVRLSRRVRTMPEHSVRKLLYFGREN